MTPRRRSQPPADRSKLKNVALFTEPESESVPSTVPLDKITLPQAQPRRYFDPQAMQSLVESVKSEGILQPLLVRPMGKTYEVVAGERRYRAAQSAGLTEVPVVVREMTDDQAVQYALVENLQREDLNPVEETEGILSLLALRLECDTAEVTSLLYRMENEAKGKITRNVSGNSEASTVEQVFVSLGRINWQSFVRTRLPLLKLPADILEALRSGLLEYTKAKEIAKLKSESERQELLEDASASSLSLSEIRERVKAAQPPNEQGNFAARIDATTKRVKKSKVWENSSKRQKLESLLAQLEKLISEEGLDESQPIEEAEATLDEPQPTAKSSQDSSPVKSGLDPKESQTGVTEEFSSNLSPSPPETAEVSDNRETPSSESLDEPQSEAKEEPTQKGSESTDELQDSSLTHTEMVERLGVKSSTLSDAKKKFNFAEWSKTKDPEGVAWQWVAESRYFVPLKN